MRRGRPVSVAVAMAMGVRVRVSMRHPEMLYYNITAVHRTSRSGPSDRHRYRRGEKGKWQRDRRAEPDKARRHKGNFPQYQPLEGKQRLGDHIGDHLRTA